MKTPKRIMAVIAIVLFSNLLFAGNPHSLTTDSITNSMVDYLHNDVKLSETQKTILKKVANEYATNLLKARTLNNSESYSLMKSATEKYQAVVDSVLTTDQKTQKEIKLKEKLDQITKSANSKK